MDSFLDLQYQCDFQPGCVPVHQLQIFNFPIRYFKLIISSNLPKNSLRIDNKVSFHFTSFKFLENILYVVFCAGPQLANAINAVNRPTILIVRNILRWSRDFARLIYFWYHLQYGQRVFINVLISKEKIAEYLIYIYF